MLNRTITKNSSFVILSVIFCLTASGCFSVSSQLDDASNVKNKIVSKDYGKPEIVGEIETKEITESSGLAASRCQSGVFWTHNDSGNKPFIFAFDSKGKKLGAFRVAGAENDDWEDMATFQDKNGECFLYIGDIGNNDRTRSELVIYRVKEPRVSQTAASADKKNPPLTERAEAVRVAYSDHPHDAETLLVHPQTEEIYILTKRLSGASGVYKLEKTFDPAKANKLRKLADFAVPAVPNGFLTGGDISPDGKRVVVCDYYGGYEIVLPENARDFDKIWSQLPQFLDLGTREQGEAVCYTPDGGAIYATSEKKRSPVIRVSRK